MRVQALIHSRDLAIVILWGSFKGSRKGMVFQRGSPFWTKTSLAVLPVEDLAKSKPGDAGMYIHACVKPCSIV